VRELYVFAPTLIPLGADQLPLVGEDVQKDSTPESVSFHVTLRLPSIAAREGWCRISLQ
jgi:hypothetical protein